MRTAKYTRRRGLTLTETLIAMLLVFMLVAAGYNLLSAAITSSDTLVWQTRVNQDARHALDAICETLRTGGELVDAYNPNANRGAMLYGGRDYVSVGNDVAGPQTIDFKTDTPIGTALTRNRELIGQFVESVVFEYEFRKAGTGNNLDPWVMVRISPYSLNDQFPDIPGAVRTVYVTVTSTARPYGNNGPVFSRTLRSAIHLRAPYNAPMPFAPTE